MNSHIIDRSTNNKRESGSQPPEMTTLDVRIERAGGTSSTIELQPHHLQRHKSYDQSDAARVKELVQENGYLRQEIIFYQESRNAMMCFHSHTLEAYEMQRSALRELSEKLALAEGRLERYWGIPPAGLRKDDIIKV